MNSAPQEEKNPEDLRSLTSLGEQKQCKSVLEAWLLLTLTRLLILAGTLEEIGVTDLKSIEHPHVLSDPVRGCWCVDLLLGRTKIMTEDEWLAATDPEPLLHFVRHSMGERKLKSFAVACCRRVWDWLGDSGRQAITILERHADGMASDVELYQARKMAHLEVMVECGTHYPSNAVLTAVTNPFRGSGPGDYYFDFAVGTSVQIAHAIRVETVASSNRQKVPVYPLTPAEVASRFVGGQAEQVAATRLSGDQGEAVERAEQCRILRDICHGPCKPVFLRRSWTRQFDGAVARLAGRIYKDCAFDLLPLLADALEEVGCADAQIIGHCRGCEIHVRGCWVVDALLGKN